MNKKRALVSFLLALLMVAGLFGPPIGQDVSAAPLSNRQIRAAVIWETTPPSTMCVGEDAPLIFSYAIAGKPDSGNFIITATMGTLSQSSWPLSELMGAGKISTTYTATQKGKGQLTISSSGNLSLSGSTTPIHFEIVDCTYDLKMVGIDIVEDEKATFDTFFSADGGFLVDETGTITGGGTYVWQLKVTMKMLPGMKCTDDETSKMVESRSTFHTGGVLLDKGALQFTIHFLPADREAIVFECKDSEGKVVGGTMLPSGTLKPDKEITPLIWHFGPGFTKGQGTFSIGKGDGTGTLTIIKRKEK